MSSARNQGRVPQTAGDTQHNVRDAALRGAALAFSKPSPKSKPATNTYTGGNNGALLAAAKVGTGGSPTALRRDLTGGSAGVSRQSLSKSPSSNSLSVPGDHTDRAPSPSNIAAKLAAARGSPLRPKPQPAAAPAPTMSERQADERNVLPPSGGVGNVLARIESKEPRQQPRKRRDSLGSQSVASTARENDQDKPTDDTPIPPTNSLVRMFEQTRPTTPTKSATEPLHITRNSPPPVRSPKPQRAFKLPPEPTDHAPLQRVKTRTPPPVKPKPKVDLPPPRSTDGAGERAYFTTPKKDPVKSPPAKQKPAQPPAIRTTNPPPKPPVQRGSRQVRPKSQDATQSPSIHKRRVSTSMESHKSPSSPSSFKSAKEEQDEVKEEKAKPSVPPPRRSNTKRTDSTPTGSRLQPTAPINIQSRAQSQKPSSLSPAQNLTPPHRPVSAAGGSSPSVYHNNYQRESVRQITKHMTGESLSSAIMGAAVAASSRNVSPAPRPNSVEPLFPRKHHHHSPFHRSPSPQKQSPPKTTNKMRTTMRKDPSSSDEEDKVDKYKKKGTRIMGIKGRKHPNKHHEGTRKRWRDQITERERKRYEGVWAANKGLHMDYPSSASQSPDDDPSLDVLNLCVKEIWSRSRLPTHVLEEIWDLVDGRGVGSLTRWEFVVGLWLIDQRLKGRKLPTRVSDSVWQSARGVGIKVKIRH